MDSKQTPLGVFGPENQAAAKLAIEQLLALAASAQISAPAAAPPPPSKTVSEAVAAFMADRKPRVKPRVWKTYRWYLGVFAAKFGAETVAALDLRAVETDSLSREWADDTRRNYLAAIEGVLKFADRAARFDKPARGSAGAEAVVSEKAYHMALGSARGDLRPLLGVLWGTGARPSEITSLTAAQIDWDNACTLKRDHKTKKRGGTWVIHFPAEAMKLLRGQAEKYDGNGLLFRTRNGNHFTCPVLTQAVWRLSERIGHRITAYGLRHTFATDALAAGVPDTHVAALLGHGSTRMLHHHYSHLGERADLLRAAAEKVRGKAA